MAIERRRITADDIAKLIEDVRARQGVSPGTDGSAAEAIDKSVRDTLGHSSVTRAPTPYLPGKQRPYSKPPKRWVPPKVEPSPIESPFETNVKKLIGERIGSYWRLGETEGPFADSLGRSPGTASGVLKRGAVSLVAHSGPAVQFDGTGSIDFQDFYDHAEKTRFTFGCWFKTEDTTPLQLVVSKTAADDSGKYMGWDVSVNDGVLAFRRAHKEDFTVVTSRLQANTTCFIVATYDGKEMRLYVNGSAADPQQSVQALVNHGAPLRLGALSDGRFIFRGTIDEAFIATEIVVTEEQAQMLYRAGRQRETDRAPLGAPNRDAAARAGR